MWQVPYWAHPLPEEWMLPTQLSGLGGVASLTRGGLGTGSKGNTQDTGLVLNRPEGDQLPASL